MMKIVECPRDAMQGIREFIPTELKARYLNKLLEVGFDVLDFGSFVSPKAIPQLADTADYLKLLNNIGKPTNLLAIVANPRGAEEAAKLPAISYIGYPFSVSETFQKRNTNRGISEAFEDVKKIQNLCEKSEIKLVLYISMGFGNPYNDKWSPEIVSNWVEKLHETGIRIFSLSDTVGSAKTDDIGNIFNFLIPKYKDAEFGAHFHSVAGQETDKIDAAYMAGCRRFDGALMGFGGCPMAADDLTGNIDTLSLISYAEKVGEKLNINIAKLNEAKLIATEIFSRYH